MVLAMGVNSVGVTVMPEYIQSEGPDYVLDNISELVGATNVTTSPYVAAETNENFGLREPPADAGTGSRRLLDRPLWGKKEVWMDTALSFNPSLFLYENLAYSPPPANELTSKAGADISEFLDSAQLRGMESWLQIQAAIPPCHRVQFGEPLLCDTPMLPDGSLGKRRVDRNASLASTNLRLYMRAFIKDICTAYPQATGLKFDWPEYPVYTFESLFFDFNPQISPFAKSLGIDLISLKRGVERFLVELSNGDIRRAKLSFENADCLLQSLTAAYPILEELVALKTAVVSDYAHFLKEVVEEESQGSKKIFLQCFPPPLNVFTGFDFAGAGAFSDVVGVKFYTMHWPVIERNYVLELSERTEIEQDKIIGSLNDLLCFSSTINRSIKDINYPDPCEPHCAPSESITKKFTIAQNALPKTTELVGITHSYGPLDDVVRRFLALKDAGADAINVNRYGYLSDEKLQALGAANKN